MSNIDPIMVYAVGILCTMFMIPVAVILNTYHNRKDEDKKTNSRSPIT